MDVQKAQISDIDALVDLRIQYITEDHGQLEIQDAATIVSASPNDGPSGVN